MTPDHDPRAQDLVDKLSDLINQFDAVASDGGAYPCPGDLLPMAPSWKRECVERLADHARRALVDLWIEVQAWA